MVELTTGLSEVILHLLANDTLLDILLYILSEFLGNRDLERSASKYGVSNNVHPHIIMEVS